MAKIIASKAEFEQILNEFQWIIVVDFFATRCGPCKMLSPVMEELATQYDENQVKILKVDVDQVPELAEEYGIVSIPTVFFGTNHKLEEGVMWANPKEFYEGKIAEYQKKSASQEGNLIA